MTSYRNCVACRLKSNNTLSADNKGSSSDISNRGVRRNTQNEILSSPHNKRPMWKFIKTISTHAFRQKSTLIIPLSKSEYGDDILQCAAKQCRKSASNASRNQSYCKVHAHRYRLEPPDDCPVCLDPIQNTDEPFECGHYVHRKCIAQWDAKCPLCRLPVKLAPAELAIVEQRRLLSRYETAQEAHQDLLQRSFADLDMQFEEMVW